MGGGLSLNAATATLIRSTVTENSASSAGGVHTPVDSVVDLVNTIVADNAAPYQPDGDARFSMSYSLLGDSSGVNITDNGGNQVDIDPRLGPLADNGGRTQTHALLPGSPAINAGDPAFTPPPATDQRGPGFSRVVGGFIDMGAVEVSPPIVRDLGAISDGMMTEPDATLRAEEVVFFSFRACR